MAVKRIGMLTGGGDVPGLNAFIKSATYRSTKRDGPAQLVQRGRPTPMMWCRVSPGISQKV